MFPMEARKPCEPDGQLQYAPFRSTVFSHRQDAFVDARGPGALFREEWNSLAGNAHRYKPLTLYQTERNVNPTRKVTVQRFYDHQETIDLSSQLTTKGNVVATLKSAVPRFNDEPDVKRGPGSYSSDRYHGAFPALFGKMTPSTVRLEKLKAKRTFAATFGIIPPPADLVTSRSKIASKRCADPNVSSARECTLAELPDMSLETTRLAAALTPRNAYQNTANRQLILAILQSECSSSPRDSVSPS